MVDADALDINEAEEIIEALEDFHRAIPQLIMLLRLAIHLARKDKNGTIN